MALKDENRAYKNNLNNGLCTQLKQRENNCQHISSNEKIKTKKKKRRTGVGGGGGISP